MSDDPLVDVFRDPSYEDGQLAERIRLSIGDELQRSDIDIKVIPLAVDPFHQGCRVTLGMTIHGRRWEFVTTQRTDSAESSRFLVACFRRALDHKMAKLDRDG